MKQQLAVAFIVAVARNGVIGRDGQLPWRLSTDLKLFRRLTMGKPIVMGRKTWESLAKRPLDGRDNIVVTRDATFQAEGAMVAHSVDDALRIARAAADARQADEVMVIGGEEIFRSTLAEADRIYLTEVHAEPAGDTFMPPLDQSQWQERSRERLERGPKDEFDAELVVLERNAQSR